MTSVPRATLEAHMATDIAFELVRVYPGYHWGVTVEGGLITIHNHELSNKRGYRIKLAETGTWHDLAKKVRHAGGEILERYGVSRERRQEDEVDNLIVDVRGEALGEVES